MNEQPIQQPEPNVTDLQPVSAVTPSVVENAKVSFKEKLKNQFLKFKENKKLFYPLTIAVSLLLALIIIGSIYKFIVNFGKTAREETESIDTPTQVVITSEEGLDEKMIKVLELENQIINNDATQRRLSPPNVNFKLEF